MGERIEVPTTHDLIHVDVDVDVDVVVHDEPWVVSVTAMADDGSTVRLTWDEIAHSATFWWHQDGTQRLRTEREAVSRILVRQNKGIIEFEVHAEWDGLRGVFTLDVGKSVTVTDTLLRI